MVRSLGAGAVCALLPGVLAGVRALGRTGRLIGVVAQAAVLAVWFVGGLAVGIVVTAIVQVVCTVGAFVSSDAWRVHREMRRARGHYLLNDDFDEESRAILRRVQAAVTAVRESSVARAGLLDDIASGVVLSHQEWEIAQILARNPGRADHVIRRVQAIERYAERVGSADVAYAERVVAAGPVESVALGEIDDLIDGARQVEVILRKDGTDSHHDGT